MKRRPGRVAAGVAALATIIVALVAITHWDAVRDHVKVWRFQLTRETRTLTPGPRSSGQSLTTIMLFHLVDTSGRPVITEASEGTVRIVLDAPVRSVHDAVRLLAINGWRVIEQRFPRRAYIVVSASDRLETQDLLWDGLHERRGQGVR